MTEKLVFGTAIRALPRLDTSEYRFVYLMIEETLVY